MAETVEIFVNGVRYLPSYGSPPDGAVVPQSGGEVIYPREPVALFGRLRRLVPWRRRPVVRGVFAYFLDRMAAGKIDGAPPLWDEQAAAVEEIREYHLSTFLDRAQEGAREFVAAVEAAEEEGGDRPILDWLFRKGGWKWLWAIAAAIALMFGVVIPPPDLPPTP